jgi:hypothetical protein
VNVGDELQKKIGIDISTWPSPDVAHIQMTRMGSSHCKFFFFIAFPSLRDALAVTSTSCFNLTITLTSFTLQSICGQVGIEDGEHRYVGGVEEEDGMGKLSTAGVVGVAV